jgi:hypothetical protein
VQQKGKNTNGGKRQKNANESQLIEPQKKGKIRKENSYMK